MSNEYNQSFCGGRRGTQGKLEHKRIVTSLGALRTTVFSVFFTFIGSTYHGGTYCPYMGGAMARMRNEANGWQRHVS